MQDPKNPPRATSRFACPSSGSLYALYGAILFLIFLFSAISGGPYTPWSYEELDYKENGVKVETAGGFSAFAGFFHVRVKPGGSKIDDDTYHSMKWWNRYGFPDDDQVYAIAQGGQSAAVISTLVALLSAIWFIVLKFKKVRHRLSEVLLGAFYLWGALMMWISAGMWENKMDQILPYHDNHKYVEYRETCYGGCALIAFSGVLYALLGIGMIVGSRLSTTSEGSAEKTCLCFGDVEAASDLSPERAFNGVESTSNSAPVAEAPVSEAISNTNV